MLIATRSRAQLSLADMRPALREDSHADDDYRRYHCSRVAPHETLLRSTSSDVLSCGDADMSNITSSAAAVICETAAHN